MHYFEYHSKSPDIFEKAKIQYPWLFSEWLPDESIEARYHLLEYLETEYRWKGRLEKDVSWVPIPIFCPDRGKKKVYWSLSHSENFTAYIVSDSPTGIDIAEYEERDESLLSTHTDTEYNLLGSKNWQNFYILWTAKEAILKKNWGTLDDMKHIFLREDLWDWYYFLEFLWDFCKIKIVYEKEIILAYTVD